MVFKTKKFQTKIFIGFGGVILLLLIIAVNGYYTLHRIHDLAQQAETDNQDNAFLLAKEIDHLKWMAQVNDLFLRDDVKVLEVETDDHNCGFGHWLYGEKSKAMAAKDSEHAKLIATIREPHRLLHESAIEIGERFVNFDTYLDGLLAERWIDHLQWTNALSKSLLTGDTFTGGLDPDQCAFGRWYHSYRADDPAFAALLKKWEDPHIRLHRSAREIVDFMEQGDTESARGVYEEKTLHALDELAGYYEETMSWIDANLVRQKEAKAIYAEKATLAMNQVQGVLGTLRGHATEDARATNTLLDAEIDKIIAVTGVLSVGGILFGLACALYVSASVGRTLKKISARMHRGAGLVKRAAAQIASSSQTMAEGASEQAASLEETTASMEEMGSMSRRNAENADNADTLMSRAQGVVDQASTSMHELTAAMDDITRASEETSKIIKTIDEIAFQTNLLALNAAVEAARAGEAGSGFAVVADEVRSLAMRAAEAARNTAVLIENTVSKVGEGAALAGKTSGDFQAVTDSIGQVGGLLAEITAASNEQARGVEQISHSVAEMDTVVQQNSASAEQSAAAADELRRQSQFLFDLVEELSQMVGRMEKEEKVRKRRPAAKSFMEKIKLLPTG